MRRILSYGKKVFPAPAGVILFLRIIDSKLKSVPRTCGGDPLGFGARDRKTEFSPHLRG